LYWNSFAGVKKQAEEVSVLVLELSDMASFVKEARGADAVRVYMSDRTL
jgi:hypothetical protein